MLSLPNTLVIRLIYSGIRAIIEGICYGKIEIGP